MNNAPKVLSNEGKDISYRLGLEMGELWVSQGHEWGFISNRVEIRRKGMSRLFIAGRSEGYSKLREDIACMSAPRTWTRVSRVETPLDFCWRWKRAPMSSEETKETRRKKKQTTYYEGKILRWQRAVETLILEITKWGASTVRMTSGGALKPGKLTLSKSVKNSGIDK